MCKVLVKKQTFMGRKKREKFIRSFMIPDINET